MTLQTTVRYGQMRVRGLFNVETEESLQPGDLALIRSSRGQELGTILATPIGANDPEMMGCGDGACGTCASSQGVVLRKAEEQDRVDYEDLRRQGTREEVRFARDAAEKLGLNMRITDAEYLFRKEKLVIHFTANARVDFRELVRDIAKEFDTRIEMKQIGARDEARLVGDMASCGRELCCRTFLHDLSPVSMRMAKQQKKTLDPSKISGQCGKLKCCLRYEDEVYVEMQKTLPKRNAWVRTEKGVGKVLTTDLLLQKLVVSVQDQREVFHISEILETGLRAEDAERSDTRPDRRTARGRSGKKVSPLKLDPKLFAGEGDGESDAPSSPPAAEPAAMPPESNAQASNVESTKPRRPRRSTRSESPRRADDAEASKAEKVETRAGDSRSSRGRRSRGGARRSGQKPERAGSGDSKSKKRDSTSRDSSKKSDKKSTSKPPRPRSRNGKSEPTKGGRGPTKPKGTDDSSSSDRNPRRRRRRRRSSE